MANVELPRSENDGLCKSCPIGVVLKPIRFPCYVLLSGYMSRSAIGSASRLYVAFGLNRTLF